MTNIFSRIDTKNLDYKPKENSLLGFKRTENSWHAVEEMELPQDIMRVNLQINFMRLDDLKYINKMNIYNFLFNYLIFN